jgi:restriction system protein
LKRAHAAPPTATMTASPDDRLEGALSELRQAVRVELLETLSQVSPTAFETIVLDLLHKMGLRHESQ